MTENNNLVYRFRTVNDYTIQSLKYSQIFLSPMETLNDPMEGIPHFYFEADKEEWKEFLYLYFISFRLFFDFRLNMDIEEIILEQEANIIFNFMKNDVLVKTKEAKEYFNTFFDTMIKDELIKKIYDDICVCGKLSHIELTYVLNCILISFAPLELNRFLPKDKHLDVKPNRNYVTLQALKESPLNGRVTDNMKFLEISNIFTKSQNNINKAICVFRKVEYIDFKFNDIFSTILNKMAYEDTTVACFSSEYTNYSMWGHYADNHKGICLIYDEKIGILQDIQYGTTPLKLNFFKNIGGTPGGVMSQIFTANGNNKIRYFTDEWRKSYWENYTMVKSFKFTDWEYENEKRIISYGGSNSYFLYNQIRSIMRKDSNPKNEAEKMNILKDLNSIPHYKKDDQKLKHIKSQVLETSWDEHHKDDIVKCLNDLIDDNTYVDYDFKKLKGVIFGIKTSFKDKEKIKAIIKQRKNDNPKHNDFKFYQAYYSHVDNQIHKVEIIDQFTNIQAID